MDHEEKPSEGFETITGARMKVVYEPGRADGPFPPWRGDDGQYFFDNEVEKFDPTKVDNDGFPVPGS